MLSACDFLAVLEAGPRVPDFWQNVLVAWGMYDAPVPHVEGAEPANGQALVAAARAYSSARAPIHYPLDAKFFGFLA